MTLNDFVKICGKNKITLDEGWSLYTSAKYRKFPEVSSEILSKFINKKLFDSRSGVSKELIYAFEEADKDNDEQGIDKEFVEHNDELLRITKKSKPFKIHEASVLDKVTDIMRNLLVNYKKDYVLDKIQQASFEYLDQSVDFSNLYITWLHLFPGEGVKNAGWESFFGVPYNGVQLRISSKTALRNFKMCSNRYDMRVFVIGTYLFIRNYIRDGKCFIPKIENFIKVQSQWYDEALVVMAEHRSDISVIFDHSYGRNSSIPSHVGGNLV